MLTNSRLQSSLRELSEITGVNLALYDKKARCLAQSGHLPLERQALRDFADSGEKERGRRGFWLFGEVQEGESYIFVAYSEEKEQEQVAMAARIAASQIRGLRRAYAERNDRPAFLRNLLLGKLEAGDIYDQAKRLRINTKEGRVVFLIETRLEEGNGAMETIESLFSSQNKDYVLGVEEEQLIVLIKSVDRREGERIDQTARMIVDMLNTEVMQTARVAYGTPKEELKELSVSYHEARTALEVGRIFDEGKKVMAYQKLGVGRLIYQLPRQHCRLFVEEVFGKEGEIVVEEETRGIVRKFFETNLNISETARQLYLHRNTLVYRIEKLERETGLDIRNFEDALMFKLALMAVDRLAAENCSGGNRGRTSVTAVSKELVTKME